MSDKTIKITTDTRGIATLTLARPEKHNALSMEMMLEITAAAQRLGADKTVRAVILAAEGKSFCAGADLNWMREQVDKTREEKMAGGRVLADMLAALNDIPKPLIGRVEGNAYGGGIGMMAVCDIVIATPNLRFALTETKLGLIPATIGPFVVRRLGEAFSRQVFFTGKAFDTDFAERASLISTICTAAEMDAAIEAEISPVLQAAPDALAAAKTLCMELAGPITDTEIDLTVEALADCWENSEAQERIATFFEKLS